MSTYKITVIGAGVGGLAVAAALGQGGHTVRVVEQAPDLTDVGAGIQISPNGLAVLRAIGCADALDKSAIRTTAARLIDGMSGREVLCLDMAKHAPDLKWYFAHRPALINALYTAAQEAGASIELGVHQEVPADGSALPGDDFLIGAGGVHSVMRRNINEDAEPFFTGQVAWRALIPGEGPSETELHMGHGRHLVSYPLEGGMRNIVAVEERSEWADEGWKHADDPANLRSAFQDFTPRVQTWLEQVQECYLWGLFRHPVAPVWHTPGQIILGDAAHPMLPFLAQGANMALEDAWVLADCLTNDRLGDYVIKRRMRVERVVDASTANARNYHLRPPMKWLAHSALRTGSKIAPAAALRRFNWLYRYDVTA